jgi:membrane protease YdiL (CAAX protease family)
MQSTGEYHNWNFDLTVESLGLLFIGTNALGIWDELFFVVTVLALLRRHLPFVWANLAQASMFTAFLYELGFRGWAPFLIFPFALLQGIVFKKTENLIYVIAIHLTLDFVLYLALINAHHSHLLPIFITR